MTFVRLSCATEGSVYKHMRVPVLFWMQSVWSVIGEFGHTGADFSSAHSVQTSSAKTTSLNIRLHHCSAALKCSFA